MLWLPPLRALQNSLDLLLARQPRPEQVVLVLLGIQHVKRINRVYGHAAAGRILASLEARLAGVARGTAMFHLGVDEFAFLLPVKDIGIAETLAEQLIDASQMSFEVNGQSVRVAVSVGLVYATQETYTAEDLLRVASNALGRARELGAGKYYSCAMDGPDESLTRTSLENEIRSALRNRGIQPYFQPIVTLSDNQVVGYEALARWNHASQGVLPPAAFLPIVEDLDLGPDLLFTMMEQGCEALAKLPGTPRLSINAAPAQLECDKAVSRLIEVALSSPVDPQSLTIEITEDSLFMDDAVAVRNLHRIRDAGMRVALDDFGSGYGNLLRMANLPLDLLKIDRQLTAMAETPIGQELLGMTIELAHRLNLVVVAEGIEDAVQMSRLRKLGCDKGQGFFFGRPQSFDCIHNEKGAAH